MTVLYLHGGGYFCSQPAHYLLFLLRLAESILNQGVSISIFALDYSLAPEHTFPTQLAEAAAAYKYILDEKRVSPGKIVVAGDSAGGHLALSLLVHLDKPFPSIPDAYGCLPKPLGLVLISPCLSLYHEPPSYVSNKHIDILSGLFLRRIATHFLNGSTEISANKEVPNRDSPYVEFLTPNPEVNWESVLPPWVCALAGADEIFFDGIRGWVETVREKLGHGRVVLNVGVEKEHAWQFLETMLDAGTKKYLESNVGDEGGFEETAKIGEMIVERMRISNH